MESKTVEKYSLLLATSEIGLGSALHGFHVPFGGHFLSVNQSVVLTLLTKESKRRISASYNCAAVSLLSAAFKLLSPIGKKLNPMIAIGIQGVLFSFAIFLLGANLLGVFLGTSLLCLWSFIQSFAFAYLFFSQSLIESLGYFNETFTRWLGVPPTSLGWLIFAFLLLKTVLACSINAYVWERPIAFETYQQTVSKWRLHSKRPEMKHGIFLGSLTDLASPWFLFSFSFTFAYVLFVQKWDLGSVLIYLIRPIFFAWISFYLIRLTLKHRMFSFLPR